MRRHLRLSSPCLALLAGCAGAPAPTATELLAGAPPGATARITLAGSEILSVAAPIEYRELPARARTTCDGIAPDGELEFCGWERGERGLGYRVEKSYVEPVQHVRSLLVDGDGNVMERSHTVPLAKVPDHVLSAALANGSFIDRAEIVSGPIREEYWHLVVRNRQGEVFLCRIGLDGESLGVRRRQHTRIDS